MGEKKHIRILEYITVMFLVIESFVRPVLKYFEWHQQGIRVNISVVYASLLLFAVVEIIIKLYARKLHFPKDLSQSLGIFLMIYILIYELVSYPFLMTHDIYRIQEFFLFYFSGTVVRGVLYLLSGFYILKILNRGRMEYFFLLLWILYTFVVLFYSDFNASFFTSSIDALRKNQNYLMMSDAYALLGFLVIAGVRKIHYRIFLIAVSVLCLFLLKSRASLYTFVVINLIGLVLLNKRFIWVSVFGVLLSFFWIDWVEFARLSANNRMFRLITLGNDHSASMRTDIMNNGLVGIKGHWFSGQFMGDVLSRKNTGTYIHNILSYWRQFGLLPFIIVLIILIRNYLKLYHLVIQRNWNKPLEFLFLYGTHCLILILFARSFVFSGIWMFFSAIPAYYYLINDE